MNDRIKKYYDLLEVTTESSKEDIKRAYKVLVKKYHPDKYVDNDLYHLAAEKMKEINEAYEYFKGNDFKHCIENEVEDVKYEENNYTSYQNRAKGDNKGKEIIELIGCLIEFIRSILAIFSAVVTFILSIVIRYIIFLLIVVILIIVTASLGI